MDDSAVNGLLDIMRGISTIASLTIVARTASYGVGELFSLDCDRCNGTGKVVCSRCHGTKTLASRPFQKVPNLQLFNRRQEDLSECFACGSTTVHDNFGPLGEEEDMHEADRIRDQSKNALRNKLAPRSKPLAGTTLCPICRGHRYSWHSIPNISKLFGFEESWFIKPIRKGIEAYCPPGWPQTHNTFMEWPGKHLRPISERRASYFGDDVFDYKDAMSDQIWNLMEEDTERKRSSSTNEGAQKEPDDLEDFRFVTVQDLSDV